MSEITYVELSQSKSSSIYENGDFKVNLDKPIIIENGDQVALYKSFIDTTLQQTEKIKLTDDIQLNLSFIMYARNWWGKVKTPVDLTVDGVFLNGALIADNEDYIICDNITSGGGVSVLDKIDYGQYRFNEGRPIKSFGGFTGTYEYQDANGDAQKTSIKIPEIDLVKNPSEKLVVDLNIRCRTNSFVDITPQKTLEERGCWDFKKKQSHAEFRYTNPPVSGDFHFSPYIQTVNVVIPAGNYDPTVLAQFITDELTRVDEVPFTDIPQGSPFLSSGEFLGMNNGVLQVGAVQSSGRVAVRDGNKVFLPVNGGNRSSPPVAGTDLEYIVGASQVALTFQDNSIFSWEFLHTPYYVGAAGTTKSIGIEYVRTNEASETYKVVNKYGGVAFTHMSANVLNSDGTVGDTFDFWENIMKFDVGSLCVVPEDVGTFQLTDTDGSVLSGTSTKLNVPLKDSVNTTGGLISIDATLDKSSETPFSYTKLTPPTCIPTEISGTFGIQATTPYDVNDAYDTPYFRVDIECSVRNKIVGEKTLFNNTFAIVGRYYELNSYNAGTSADSLVYVHKGEPVVMSSLNVRILDNEGKMPVRLGADNTIYLQVVKSQGSIVPRTP